MFRKKFRKSWKKIEWFEFSNKVKQRDNFKCLNCNRNSTEVVLQVHHEIYRENKLPWEYALSDCITLCRGCHAREHNLIEPNSGWFLISINDLGALDGICERNNCNSNIRYEHLTYHPNWGYKIVGSTCIEHLTQQDKLQSKDILNTYKKISHFISNSKWESGLTTNSKRYLETKYKYHIIRIYGTDKKYSFQLAIKEKGSRSKDWKKPLFIKNIGLEEIKELAFIGLLGNITEDTKEKQSLRNIYKNIKQIAKTNKSL